MRKLFTRLFLVIVCFAFIQVGDVHATSGALRRRTIKTCPNGVTYGLHGNGNNNTHWHEAKTNGESYYATGEPLSGDPCPESSTNKGTAESTKKSSNDTSSSTQSTTSSSKTTTKIILR